MLTGGQRDESVDERMPQGSPRKRIEVRTAASESAPHPLLPPEAFPDTRPDPVERETIDGVSPEETGPGSRTVRARLASSCAGWPRAPTGEEFYEAIRAGRPTPRQCAIIGTWAREATPGEIVQGWLEEAYTWPLLAAALHRCGCEHPPLHRMLNGFARADWISEENTAWKSGREPK